MDLPSPTDPFTWLLVAALGFSRSMDFLSTWMVTPRLALEANPLLRRLRWGRMALLNVPLLALPLVHHGLAITFVVTSLLAAGTNLAGGALALGQGERAHAEQQARAVRRLGLGNALLLNTAGGLLVAVGGAFMMALAPRPESPSWWAGLGVVMFGATGLVHYSLALVRLHRMGRRLPG